MNKLSVYLKNCYGINSFDEEFDFSSGTDSKKVKAYTVYAPNGLMKSSFAKTFEAISKGEEPKEERFGRPSDFQIKKDDHNIEKNDTDLITVGQYYEVYNRLFGTSYDTSSTQKVKDMLFLKADEICSNTSHDGLNLGNTVLLSMAIRMQSEIYLLHEIRKLNNDKNYWCQKEKQFGCLMKKFQSLNPSASSLAKLEKVSITVSSNIHLNSFMYEPILDLTIEHL